MKITVAFLIAVFAFLNWASASAEPPSAASSVAPTNAAPAAGSFKAVSDFMFTVDFHKGLVEMNMIGIPDPQMAALTGHTMLDSAKGVTDDCTAALKEIDAGIGPALKQAKADPQLLAATKALYVAAQDYFTNLPPSFLTSYGVMQMTHARLKSELDAKLNELKLDLKMAQP